MKVILNVDVKHLGEEGDVKNVANGYARNFLLPRNLAVPYNDATVAIFEAKKAEIEARKEQKRKDSASLKERLEALTINLAMPAGNNGKLFGSVTNNVIADYLAKEGFEIERKKIEVPGVAIKTVGNYTVTVKLYEAQTAEIKVAVTAQEDNTASKSEPKGKKPAVKSASATESKVAPAEDAPKAESTETKAE